MDIRKVKKLIELLEESGIAEIEIKEGEESVRISRGSAPQHMHYSIPQYAAPQLNVHGIQDTTHANQATKPDHQAVTGTPINSPMVGTFYTASAPGNPPFVKVGDKVHVGDVVCIIEAMKMINQITSDVSGTVKSILVDNAQPVEYGQAMFILE